METIQLKTTNKSVNCLNLDVIEHQQSLILFIKCNRKSIKMEIEQKTLWKWKNIYLNMMSMRKKVIHKDCVRNARMY